jgi:hypothetical protein
MQAGRITQAVILLLIVGVVTSQWVRSVLTDAFVWLVLSSPFIVVLGAPALALGAILVPVVPGRPKAKWTVFTVILVLWASVFLALFTPGVVELP